MDAAESQMWHLLQTDVTFKRHLGLMENQIKKIRKNVAAKRNINDVILELDVLSKSAKAFADYVEEHKKKYFSK